MEIEQATKTLELIHNTLVTINDTLGCISTLLAKQQTPYDGYSTTAGEALRIADAVCKNSMCETCTFRDSPSCFNDLIERIEKGWYDE